MGEQDALKGQKDQARPVEFNDTGWIKHVIEEKPSTPDGKQQRQDQTKGCVDKGLLPSCELSSDTSAKEIPAPKVTRDEQGHITTAEHANGVKYEYKNLDGNGQPTCIKITKAGDKDYGEWKKEEDGLWRAYHNGKPTMEVIVGEWKVNARGELSHTGHQEMRSVSTEGAEKRATEEQSKHRETAEKVERVAETRVKAETNDISNSSLKRNADGKVTEITNAQGETTHFKYGENGRLTEVQLPGGTTLTTTDGFNWKNSETGNTQKLDIRVQNDGTYSIEMDHKKAVLLPNGNSVRMDTDYPHPDRVTSVTKADGQTTSFKYSSDGKLNEVTLPGGTKLTTTDGGKTWLNSETGKTSDVKVEVKSDGTWSLELGGKKAAMRPDGSEVRSEVTPGAPDRVTSVNHADGRKSEFKYGPDGKLNEVKMPGGTVLTTTDGGKTWTSSETGKTSEMRINVSSDGSYTVERDGKMGIINPDGSAGAVTRTLEAPGKVKETHAAGSRPGHPNEEIVYENGTVRELRPDGVTVETRGNMTVMEKPDHAVSVTIGNDTRVAKPFHPERGVKSTSVDEEGNVTYVYNDGTSSIQYRGGGVQDKLANGDWKLYLGAEVIQESRKQPDGSVVATADGRVSYTEHPKVNRVFWYDDNGGLKQVLGDQGTWDLVKGPDGKEYWQNKENPSKQWHGKMSVDQQGNLHYTPDDPNAAAWIFTRDGREIPVSRSGHAKASNDGRQVSAPKDSAKREPRGPIIIDKSVTDVPITRDIFDKEGTPSTVKGTANRK